MSPALLPLLGAVLMWPGVQALTCQWGTFEALQYTSRMPLQWTAGQRVCEGDEGCQTMLVLTENGEKAPRAPRQSPLCRAETCLSLPGPTCLLRRTERPLSSLPELSASPAGAPLWVPSCLLSSLSAQARMQSLPPGHTRASPSAMFPSPHPGPLVYIVLTKGCAQATDHEARITKHNPGPGVSVISYTRVCRQDACSDLPTTLPLWDLPSPTVPRGRGGGRGGGQHLG